MSEKEEIKRWKQLQKKIEDSIEEKEQELKQLPIQGDLEVRMSDVEERVIRLELGHLSHLLSDVKESIEVSKFKEKFGSKLEQMTENHQRDMQRLEEAKEKFKRQTERHEKKWQEIQEKYSDI